MIVCNSTKNAFPSYEYLRKFKPQRFENHIEVAWCDMLHILKYFYILIINEKVLFKIKIVLWK